MISLEDFVSRIEEEFDELSPGQIDPHADYTQYMEWNSMNTLLLMALVRAETGKLVTVSELRSCSTIGELHEILSKK